MQFCFRCSFGLGAVLFLGAVFVGAVFVLGAVCIEGQFFYVGSFFFSSVIESLILLFSIFFC